MRKESVNFRIKPSHKEWLDNKAAVKDTDRSDIINSCIEAAMKEDKEDEEIQIQKGNTTYIIWHKRSLYTINRINKNNPFGEKLETFATLQEAFDFVLKRIEHD